MKDIKSKSVLDATVLAIGAILEALPPDVRDDAAAHVRDCIRAGLANDAQSERIVRGIFLLDEPA